MTFDYSGQAQCDRSPTRSVSCSDDETKYLSLTAWHFMATPSLPFSRTQFRSASTHQERDA